MTTRWLRTLLALTVAAGLGQAGAKEKKDDAHTGTKQSSRLYTAPDASDPGGLRGHIGYPKLPLLGAFAIPNSETIRCFKATLSKDGHSFEFNNLPTAKYDLVLLFPQMFYEGMTLNRSASSLATNDWKSILEILSKSEPFYEIKRIHRMDGVSGGAGWAQAIFQQVRARPVTLQDASVHNDIQIRTIKLARFENVGPAWQLLVTREIVRQEVANNERKGLLPHFHVPDKLGNLRVVDTVKDLGTLELPEPK
jgi:hypothetical protein